MITPHISMNENGHVHIEWSEVVFGVGLYLDIRNKPGWYSVEALRVDNAISDGTEYEHHSKYVGDACGSIRSHLDWFEEAYKRRHGK